MPRTIAKDRTSITAIEANTLIYPVLKRVFDLAAATVGIVALAPLLVLIAISIKLDSPGPVFYLGRRTGFRGLPFHIIKFRTMVDGGEHKGGGTTALNDPRVTRVGKWLRRRKLDELPQLFNIVKNDMSFVGPRPELPYYTSRYTGDELLILSVKPGLTDFSSIEFAALDEVVGAIDADRVFEEQVLPRKNRLRIDYVKQQGFITDLRVLARTAAKVFGKLWH